ncbi:MAG: hypothetical protein DRH49_07175 [Candidatus Coatesbacteria bacterium]|nr:MAG: hypothetical protein DRH49_07175 [Candidatus Coatesbacteria bacterium]
MSDKMIIIILISLLCISSNLILAFGDYQFSMSGNNKFQYLLVDEEGENKGKQYISDRLEVSVLWGPFEVGTVVNIDYPRWVRFIGEEEDRAEMSQLYLTYTSEKLDATGGTIIKSMGRGMTLHATEDLDIDLEHYLKGAGVSFRPVEYLEITGLGGKGEWRYSGQEDRVIAGEVEVSPLGMTSTSIQPFVDFSMSHINIPIDPESDIVYDQRYILLGGGAYLPFCEGEFYYARRDMVKSASPGEPKTKGEAIYLTANGTISRFASVEFEYKRYDNYCDFVSHFITPPNATIFGDSINEGNNEQGFLIGANSQPIDGLHLHFAYAFGNQVKKVEPQIKVKEMQIDAMVQDIIPRVDPGGYLEFQDEFERKSIRVRPFATFFMTEKHSITGSIEFEKRTEKFWENRPTFKDQILELEYYWTGNVSALWRFEWTDQKRDQMGESIRHNWNFIEVKYIINPRSEFSVGYGQLRGGKVCSGGACFWESPFKGLRAKLTSVF